MLINKMALFNDTMQQYLFLFPLINIFALYIFLLPFHIPLERMLFLYQVMYYHQLKKEKNKMFPFNSNSN